VHLKRGFGEPSGPGSAQTPSERRTA
jgi:hypothetical protein